MPVPAPFPRAGGKPCSGSGLRCRLGGSGAPRCGTGAPEPAATRFCRNTSGVGGGVSREAPPAACEPGSTGCRGAFAARVKPEPRDGDAPGYPRPGITGRVVSSPVRERARCVSRGNNPVLGKPPPVSRARHNPPASIWRRLKRWIDLQLMGCRSLTLSPTSPVFAP